MIKNNNSSNLRCKCVLNLTKDDNYFVENRSGIINIIKDSVIVDLEITEILSERIICLEMVAIGYEGLNNTYKRFLLFEREIKDSFDNVISKKDIDTLYLDYDNMNTIRNIVANVLIVVDPTYYRK